MKSAIPILLTVLALAALVAAVFGSYASALGGGFVYDDPLLILENPQVTNPEVGFLSLFVEPYFGAGGGGAGFYRPLMTLLFRFEFGLFGQNPRGFHFTNVLIHAGGCIFLFLLLIYLDAPRIVSFVASLFFAVHPVTTESIAWISGRTDPLVFILMMVSLLYLCRHWKSGFTSREGDRMIFPFAISLFFFLCALLVKEIAYVFILAIAVLAIGIYGTRFLKFGAYASLLILVIAVRCLIPEGEAVEFFTGRGEWWERGLTFLSVIPDYLGKIFWPFHLSLARPADLVSSPLNLRVLAGLFILIAGGAALVFGIKRKNAALAVGAVIFLSTLLAVSNLVPIPYGFREMDFPFFERYLYIPLAGLLMMLAGLTANRKGWLVPALALLAALLCCPVLGHGTWKRCRDWRDDETLFLSGIKSWWGSPTLWFNLGQAFFDGEKYLEAQAAFHRAALLDPKLSMARVQEAMALHELGRVEETKTLLRKTLEAEPENWQAWEALGIVSAVESRWLKTIEYYSRAAMILKDCSGHGRIFAAVLASRNEAARRLRPEVEALYLEKKDYSRVLAMTDELLMWHPGCAWAYEARGVALAEMGEEDGALGALEAAVALDEAQSLVAMGKLIELYAKKGRVEEAKRLQYRLRQYLERLDLPEDLRKRADEMKGK